MIEPTMVRPDPYTFQVSHVCRCGRETSARVDDAAVYRWRRGEEVQAAFAELSPSDREALFISGICGSCWDRLFGEPE